MEMWSPRNNSTFPEDRIKIKEVVAVVVVVEAAGVIPMVVEVVAAAGEVEPTRMVAANTMINLGTTTQGTTITIEEEEVGAVGTLIIITMVRQCKVVMPQLMLG